MRGLFLTLLFFATTPCWAANNVVILLDSSGSMGYSIRRAGITRMEAAHQALESVIKQMPEGTVLGLASFDGWIFEPVAVDKNRAELIQKTKEIIPSGGTPLGAYMQEAGTQLLKLRTNDPSGLFRLVIVTDGEAGDRWLVKKAMPDILSRGILVDVIGCDMDGEHSLKQQAHSYRSADDVQALKQALSSAVAEVSLSSDESKIQEQFDDIAGLNTDVCRVVLKTLASQVKANQGVNGLYEETLKFSFVGEDGKEVVVETEPNIIYEDESGYGWLICVIIIGVIGMAGIIVFLSVCGRD